MNSLIVIQPEFSSGDYIVFAGLLPVRIVEFSWSFKQRAAVRFLPMLLAAIKTMIADANAISRSGTLSLSGFKPDPHRRNKRCTLIVFNYDFIRLSHSPIS
jgi:hypothetical protein|tara:strand:- start:260 stop:562 length:303 start_codon:yes stop_codon:yes gene_type:complete